MNEERFNAQWSQLKGEIKKQWGKFTDDDLMQIEGNMQKFMGKAQERYGEQKGEVTKWVNNWLEKLEKSTKSV